MKKQIATLVFVIVSMISFAGDGFDLSIEKTGYKITHDVSMEINSSLAGMVSRGVFNDSNHTDFKNPNPEGENTWISKTIFVFSSGFDLAGFNVKLNKFNMIKKSGWVHQKENNLHADITNNGLSIKFKF